MDENKRSADTKPMEIIEAKNKVIAEFMGAILFSSKTYKFTFEFGMKENWDESGYLGSSSDFYWDIDELLYHSSLDWLMPVVEKIAKDGYGVNIETRFYPNKLMWNCDIFKKRLLSSHENQLQILAVHEAVFQFIKQLKK